MDSSSTSPAPAATIAPATTTTTTLPTTTTTTTAAPPDVATLLDQLLTLAELDRTGDDIDSVDSAVVGFSCDDIASYAFDTTVDRSGHTPSAVSGAQAIAPGAAWPWTVGFAVFASDEAAIAVVESFEELTDTCPSGVRQIPLEAPDGSQATDKAGNPVFIPANLTTTAFEFAAGDTSAAHATAIEFAGASGDTVVYRAVAQRGPIVFYLEGQGPSAEVERLGELFDQTLPPHR